MLQWLRLRASNAGNMGSIPGQGSLHAAQCGQNFKKRGSSKQVLNYQTRLKKYNDSIYVIYDDDDHHK